MINVREFTKEHTNIFFYTLGMAIFGCLAYQTVRWIIKKCQKTENIDRVAQVSLPRQEAIPPSSVENAFPSSSPLNPTQELAAKTIQRSYRMHVARLELRKLKADKQISDEQKMLAAQTIQRSYRVHVAHLELTKLKADKLEQQRSRTALIIQCAWRRRSARIEVEQRKKALLDHTLFEQAKPYIDTPSNLLSLPKAPDGKTTVYLPKELPIVLKLSGTGKNQERFDQMQQAREICEANGYERLIIPKARVYKDFIIETRLPIASMRGTKEQMALYMENRERFTRTVQEFIGFLCQSSFYDLLGDSRNPYGKLARTPVVRYDNIPLYLEEGQGKIGLIDLEHFSPQLNKRDKDWCFYRCSDAVRIFPYHLEEIMSTAKEFDPNIEGYRKNLEEERDETLKRYKIACEDHLTFVREKGVTWENPIAFEKLGPTRTEQLKNVVEIELRKLNDDDWSKGYLGSEPDETLRQFNETAFPVILNAVYKLITDRLKRQLKLIDKPISSDAELICVRTLLISPGESVYREFMENTLETVKIFPFKKYSYSARNLSRDILDIFLKELEQGQEIAYYNPEFGYGCRTFRCLFC